VILVPPSADNVIATNDLRGNQIGVFAGAYSRNNTYRANNVTDNSIAGYFLRGPERIFVFQFGPASGNVVVGAALQSKGATVIDATGCAPGTGDCPQLDDDGDGSTGEDPIDSVNNDGDLVLCACGPTGFQFVDEDPDETPSFITGMQAIHDPVVPPWATKDQDGDGLPDALERKLSAMGYCTAVDKHDSDGDGISDADEFRNGTAAACSGSLVFF
jgi:hypothetical protein